MALNFLPVGKPSYGLATPPTTKPSRPLAPINTSTSSKSTTPRKAYSPPLTPVEKPCNRPFAETGGMPWAPERREKVPQGSAASRRQYDGSDLKSPLDRRGSKISQGPLMDWFASKEEGSDSDDEDSMMEGPMPARRLFFTPAAQGASGHMKYKERRAAGAEDKVTEAQHQRLLPPMMVSPSQSPRRADTRRSQIPQSAQMSRASSVSSRMMDPPTLASSSSTATAAATPSVASTPTVGASSSAVSSLLSRRRSARQGSQATSSSPMTRVRSTSNALALCTDVPPSLSCCSAGAATGTSTSGSLMSSYPSSPLSTSMGRSRSNSSASSQMDYPRLHPGGPSPMLTRLQSSKLPRGRSRSSSLSLSTTPGSVTSRMSRGRTMTPDYFGAWEASVPLAQRRGKRVEILRQREREREKEMQLEREAVDLERKRRRVLRDGRRGV